MDAVRLGPAPTRSREIFVIVITVVVLAAGFVAFQPPAALAAVVAAVIAAHMAVRWVLGSRKWGRA
ncbi:MULTISPECIES: hypothetical protein [Tsukamurella]|uniref:Uncharacterized protein n=1 Tax=Tsukamurella strandjordii TaxID=147577 RepID=A0AA90N9J4_9ACTN|nr:MULTISPECIES: hypothetical protein [Tsukamurella]MDP0398176.1 hypothetical protein [Tsukamurella strandjordii]GIZ97990.1 hypothetical protein TTY48_26020 [Tsukamurella sp. TY48]